MSQMWESTIISSYDLAKVEKDQLKTGIPREIYEEKISHHDGVHFSAAVQKDN